MLTSAFVDIVQGFNQRAPISTSNSTCKGLYSTNVTSAGLVASCSESIHPFHLSLSDDEDASEEEKERHTQELINGTDIFGTYFVWLDDAGAQTTEDSFGMTLGTFNLGVQFK